MTHGCLSSGSKLTTEAGLFAFKHGGNAIDAAVASKLAATVTEPLLTGLGGSGLCLVKYKNQHFVVDMFTTMPGLKGVKKTFPMDELCIDFGPTQQTFWTGLGAVSTPTLPMGLAKLHSAFGKIPLKKLIEPAIGFAQSGFVVSTQFARILELLWPICTQSIEVKELYSNANNERLQAGDIFYYPQVVDSLKRFASVGETFFHKYNLTKFIGDRGPLRNEDINKYQTQVYRTQKVRLNKSTIHLPNIPSVSGVTLQIVINHLSQLEKCNEPVGIKQIEQIINSLKLLENNDENTPRKIFDNQYKYTDLLNFREISTGHTTHISSVDEDGNAVSITSSLGEGSGHMVPESGVVLNNFLGEVDVAPSFVHNYPGRRLLTMCCPIIIENEKGILVMGSGGSSRIRSAILHGILYSVIHDLEPDKVTSFPRSHLQDNMIHVETSLRTNSTIDKLHNLYGESLRLFNGPNMYFGGLHIAGMKNGKFIGSGDKRRAGYYGEV